MFGIGGTEHIVQRRDIGRGIEPGRRAVTKQRAATHPDVEEVAADDKMRTVDRRLGERRQAGER